MSEKIEVKGIYPALVTPMNSDESINEEGLKKIIEHVINGGVHGLFILGSQGESFALNPDEKKQVIEISVETVADRIPVCVGTGMITTAQSVKFTRTAKELGVNSISVITPYFISPNQKELLEHFKTIAEAADGVPVLLYNNPNRTGVSISIETVIKMAEIDNVAGMKDSSADLIQTMNYIEATKDMDFSVMVGNDASIFATLLSGGKGAVAATANVAPELIVGIYESVMAGDIEKARELQYALFPIRKAFKLGTFPVVVKEALNIMGLPAGPARKPVTGLTSDKKKELKNILQKAGLIK
ncbi:4-hydroxy-tetrahydrodipicolinate synthase [Candidatus Poribacteria bacterium]|nr:4-hydroxy-tetrahydrodipicolinate synthase [Candidatus Poribacteria bacterium]